MYELKEDQDINKKTTTTKIVLHPKNTLQFMYELKEDQDIVLVQILY